MHGESGSTLGVVPGNVDASEFCAGPISGDRVVFLQGGQEMFGMLAVAILNSEVVDNEGKRDWSPFVAPQTRGSRGLVVAVFVEAGRKEVVGKFAGLLEPIHSFLDLEVDPSVAGERSEIIFIDELVWYDGELYFDVFMPVQGSAEIEVGYIETGKLRVWRGECAVDEEFNSLEGGSTGAGVTGVCNTIAPNGDVGAEGISFLWTNIADDPCIGDVVSAIDRDISETNGRECVGAFDPFEMGGCGVCVYTLA